MILHHSSGVCALGVNASGHLDKDKFVSHYLSAKLGVVGTLCVCGGGWGQGSVFILSFFFSSGTDWLCFSKSAAGMWWHPQSLALPKYHIYSHSHPFSLGRCVQTFAIDEAAN